MIMRKFMIMMRILMIVISVTNNSPFMIVPSALNFFLAYI